MSPCMRTIRSLKVQRFKYINVNSLGIAEAQSVDKVAKTTRLFDDY